jgi:membrane fusion protein (multidrug efflux system)
VTAQLLEAQLARRLRKSASTVSLGDVGLVTVAGRLEGLARGAGQGACGRHFAEAFVSRRQRRKTKASRFSPLIRALCRANLSAKAARHAEANAAQTTALAERYKPAGPEANAVSKQEYANAVGAEAGRNRCCSSQGRCSGCGINYGYAAVTSPFLARIGRAFRHGRLHWWARGEATQLAVVQQINPMYVNFTQGPPVR